MDFNFDFQFGKQVIGVDEVGRGSWAGPVMACASLLDYQKPIDRRLDDSKKLSHKIRKEILSTLTKNSIFGIGIVAIFIGLISKKVINYPTRGCMKRTQEITFNI